MKYVVLALVMGTLLLVGCSSAVPAPAPPAPALPAPTLEPADGEEATASPKPVVIVPSQKVELDFEGAITAIPVTYELSDRGAVGFEPGIYTIDNLSPGREADLLITLHSGRDEPVAFVMSYRTPSYTKEGWVLPPREAEDWLSFETHTPILKAQEMRGFVVTLSLPEDAVVSSQWEFWIAIKEAGQTSQVQTEGCLRVFVKS